MASRALTLEAQQTLRRLTSNQALEFCSRLLSRTVNDVLTFDEFHATARDLIDEQPHDAALFLAALVALDMSPPEAEPEPPQRPLPCPN